MNIPRFRTPASFPIGVVVSQNCEATVSYTPVAVNDPPSVPSNHSPTHGAVNVARLGPTFSWTGGDPDGPVEYAFYSDTNPNPGVYAGFGSITGSSFQIGGNLLAATTYYWKVRARDSQGVITDGPVWRFTTEYSYADLVASGLSADGNIEPGAPLSQRPHRLRRLS
jgi:hypothetical protein